MFSSDTNIETIAQLVEETKKYLSLKGEYYKLDVVDKAVRVITALVMVFILTIILLLAIVYFSFALAFGLGCWIGNVGAFCIVGTIYLVLFVICIINRERWIERPIVRFLASLMMD